MKTEMEIKQKDWRYKTAKIFSNLMYLVDAKIIADLHESIDSLIVSLLSHREEEVKRELRDKVEDLPRAWFSNEPQNIFIKRDAVLSLLTDNFADDTDVIDKGDENNE